MDYINIPSAMEALQNPLPKSFHISAPYQHQIQQMEEQNKKSAFLIMVLIVIAGATIIAMTSYEAKAWQRTAEKKL
jgi:cell division protein FtsX